MSIVEPDTMVAASVFDGLEGVSNTGALGLGGLACAKVDPARAVDVLGTLKRERGFTHLSLLTAADGHDGEPLELIYALTRRSDATTAVVKVPLEPGAIPDSICTLWSGAAPLEREVFDLFGVEFIGHPDLTRIVLRDDFVGHPLLKDYEMDSAGVSLDATRAAIDVHTDASGFPEPNTGHPGDSTDNLVLNMGPQHPSMHGVLHLWLELDGERVVRAKPTHGYLHRCIEKLCESRSYRACIALMDRADYVSGFHTELALLLAYEELAGIDVTPRAEYLRVLFCELCRITSHHTWLAACGLDIGALTPFLYAFHYRERIADVYEAVTGSRMMFNYFRPGGVKADLPAGVAQTIRDILTTFDAQVDEYEALLTGNEIFRARTRGIGPIDPQTIVDHCVTGPMARASGVDIDLRRDEPYSVYGEMEFDVPVCEVGDTFDRYAVRIAEMRQSARIALQALDALPDGPVCNPDVPRVLRPPAGSAYRRVESPRGELGVLLVSQGDTSPWRLKIRSPALSNLHVSTAVLPGCSIGDAVAVMGSVDVVMGEIDR